MTTRNWMLVVCLDAALGAAGALGQLSSPLSRGNREAANSPVAYIYVTSDQPNGVNEIIAYSAAANGSLTPIPGSPFSEDVSSMAVNGKYLMGASREKPDINAYHIAADGSLTFTAGTDYAVFNNPNNPCGAAGQLFFDHTGTTLYVQEFNGSDACAIPSWLHST